MPLLFEDVEGQAVEAQGSARIDPCHGTGVESSLTVVESGYDSDSSMPSLATISSDDEAHATGTRSHRSRSGSRPASRNSYIRNGDTIPRYAFNAYTWPVEQLINEND